MFDGIWNRWRKFRSPRGTRRRAFGWSNRAYFAERQSLRLQIEPLEHRELMSVNPAGAEFRVNTYTAGEQRTFFDSKQSVAMDEFGNFVITWASDEQDGSGYGVYAQRFNAAGTPQGSEFRVNTYTTREQRDSTIAMDANGNFVVVWADGHDSVDFPTGEGQDGDGYGIFAQRFNAGGTPQGSEFRVNSYTSGDQRWPTVAMADDGDFVVTWSGDQGNAHEVFAQRFGADGAPQGSEFRVNTYTSSNQNHSTIAMNGDGDLVVAWTSLNQNESLYNVYAQRYTASGVAQGSEFLVNSSTTGEQRYNAVAMDESGNFVITWSSLPGEGSDWAVYAQRFDASGVPQGTAFLVNTTTTYRQSRSTVAMDAGGDFIITWPHIGHVAGNYDLYAQKFSAAGAPQGSEFRVNSYTTDDQIRPTVAMNASGDFVIAWTSDSQDGDHHGVYAQRYLSSVRVAEVRAVGDPTAITEAERLVANNPSGPSLQVTFTQEMSQAGGASGPSSVTNPANWSLTKDGADISSQVTSVSYSGTIATLTLSGSLTTGSYALIAKDSILDAGGNALDGDANGAAGGNFTRTFEIEPPASIGTHFRVNSYTTGPQEHVEAQAIAADAAGNYVITWSSDGQDGSKWGVYAQRYNAHSAPQGSEFRVNTFTTDHQADSAVAMSPSGDFVITWVSLVQDGSDAGVFAQRFSADGAPQGSEFQVNAYTTSVQAEPAVAMAADGSFVITWTQDPDLFGRGVFAQRFDAVGTRLGSEFKVSSWATATQSDSMIAMAHDGNFVVVWQDNISLDFAEGIYARRFDASGVPLGSDFHVNAYSTENQFAANVAMSPGGDFVITWSSHEQDGDSNGVYAQRYNAAGAPQGSEFRVNTFPLNSQSTSRVAIDADGDFVIVWESNRQYLSDQAIFAQRYSSTGVKQGSEFRITGSSTSYQIPATVAMNAEGDFVVVWRDIVRAGGESDVYAHRFAAPATHVSEVRVVGQTTAIAEGERLVAGIAAGASLQAAFHRAVSQAGGVSGAASVTNPANWSLTQNGVDITSQISNIAYSDGIATFTLATALNAGEYVLTARQTILDLDGQQLDGNLDHVPGGDFHRSFEILPPVVMGSEFRVNNYTTGSQTNFSDNLRTVAMDGAGNFVVTWSSLGQDGSGYGVFAQRFAASGARQGSEFRVNTSIAGHQRYPSVARTSDGSFVIAWSSSGQDGSGEGIYAQRYNMNGVKQGTEFRVNTTTSLDQSGPVVGFDNNRNVMIAWTSSDQDGNGQGIYAQRLDLFSGLQGSEFRINSITLGNQVVNSLAMDTDGDFVVTWTDSQSDGDQSGIYARRFDVLGNAKGSEFRVNTYVTGVQRSSMAAIDADGNFVVVWVGPNTTGVGDRVYAQRYDAAGLPLGSEFQVHVATLGIQFEPSVDMDDDGDFVIIWGDDDGDYTGVYARRFDSQGNPVAPAFLANSTATSSQFRGSVALDRDGDFVIGWTSAGQDGSGSGLFAQRYYAPTTRVSEVRVVGQLSPIVEADRLISTVPVGASLQVTFTHPMSQVGGATGTTSVTNPFYWNLTKNGIDISSQITSISYQGLVALVTLSDTLGTGDYVLRVWSLIRDTHGALLDGDANESPGGDFVRHFQIAPPVPVSGEFQINTYTTSNQSTDPLNPQSVATDAAGNFVVTWESIHDGSGLGIFAQRFDATGAPLGSEFQVNTYTSGSQRYPTVAMDADGDFVITWSSHLQDFSNDGVYAQRFNSAGIPQGSEFQVNSAYFGAQGYSTVAMDNAGNFVIAWTTDAQTSSVYARKYNAAGDPQTPEFQVNGYSTSVQARAKVAMDRDGDFVVTWASKGQDGSDYGVFARLYTPAAVAKGSEFQVNTTTSFAQTYSSVGMSPLGDFVITWSSTGQDSSNDGVYAQRYNALGTPAGSEFRVNSYVTAYQRFSAAAMDVHGDFVIVWASENNQDGSGSGVYAQRYRATGDMQGSEFRINSYTTSDQTLPWISMDADGDFVVAWTSAWQDGHFFGMHGQRFASSPLQVSKLTPTATGFEMEFNHPIDPSALNLYDENGEFGSADVALVGEVTGEVRGSLVVAPGARKVTFVKSGDVLVPDRYTIQLKSGLQGFKGVDGDLLDGNLDESQGDNYSGNFTIAAPAPEAIVLGVPDITRGFGQAVHMPASGNLGIPISISSGQHVTGVDFELRYDPALLSISSVSLPPGITGGLTYGFTSPGVLQMSLGAHNTFSTQPGPLTILTLTAEVPSDVPYGAKQVLDIANLFVWGDSLELDELPSIDDDGIHIAAYVGDANGSQSYNAPDATAAQRLIVGLDTGFASYQLADPYLIVDINGNGQVQSDDVTQIQRAIVGLSTLQIPPHPGLAPALAGGPDPIVSLPQNLAASVGETVVVPVELFVTESTGITLAGADIAIAYDASTLELTAADVGQLLVGFGLSVNTTTPGVIRLTLTGSPLDLPYAASGVLANLRFTVLAGAGSATPLNLLASSDSLQTALYDDVGRALTLAPVPTNDQHDTVDGLLSIFADPIDLEEGDWQRAVDLVYGESD